MHLVVHHVSQFQEVGDPYRCRLVEAFARAAVVEVGFSVAGDTGFVRPFVQVIQRSTVENRGGKLHVHLSACPAQDGFKYLSEVHAGRHTQWVEANINGRTVFHERHILLTDNLGNDALVTVTTRHLVAHLYLTLLGYIYFRHLHDTCWQFVAYRDVKFLAPQFGIQLFEFLQVVDNHHFNQFVLLVVCRPFAYLNDIVVQLFQRPAGEFGAFGDYLRIQVVLNALRGFIACQHHQFVNQQAFQFSFLFFVLLIYFRKNGFVGQARFILFLCCS
ncbi:hypothetical protein Barb6_03736 [Bacteroidales bacterium Barb6]|nr:hypothetical protein Barb6_03736 [Bacteroidales bacterium Barb6]